MGGVVGLKRALGEVLLRISEIEAEHLRKRALPLEHRLDLGAGEGRTEIHCQAAYCGVAVAREALCLEVINTPSPLLQRDVIDRGAPARLDLDHAGTKRWLG